MGLRRGELSEIYESMYPLRTEQYVSCVGIAIALDTRSLR